MFPKKNGRDYRQVSLHEATNGYSDSSDEDEDEDDFVQSHMRKQQLHLQQQDKGLEMLSQSADRLGTMSLTISSELDQQNRMLDDMEDDLGQTNEDLDLLTRKTRELIQKSGGQKTFCIIVALTLVVIFLIFLILYT